MPDAESYVDRIRGCRLCDPSWFDGFRPVYNLDLTDGYIEEDWALIVV